MKNSNALIFLLLASCSPSGRPPELHLSDGWARETAAGQTVAAAYVAISNDGGSADTLVSVTAPAPLRASVHATVYEGGIARMRPLEGGLEIPAGETVMLRPAGPHIMLENLAAPLAAGDRLRLTLRFTRSGERMLDVAVRAAGAAGPAHERH